MRLALFGPPGAGKGTQSMLLKKRFGLDVISTGNLIRGAIQESTDLGRSVEKYVNAGNLVPDLLVRDLANQAMAEHKFDRFILDGYPRTTTQSKWLMEFLDAYKAPIEAVISLKVSAEAVVDRLSNRRINRDTGESYHMIYHPPPSDLDPSLIIQRSDDRPQAIKARISAYRSETQPVEEFFRSEGILVEISGEGEVSEVFNRILSSIEPIAELELV